jgi:hypothetical protein
MGLPAASVAGVSDLTSGATVGEPLSVDVGSPPPPQAASATQIEAVAEITANEGAVKSDFLDGIEDTRLILHRKEGVPNLRQLRVGYGYHQAGGFNPTSEGPE